MVPVQIGSLGEKNMRAVSKGLLFLLFISLISLAGCSSQKPGAESTSSSTVAAQTTKSQQSASLDVSVAEAVERSMNRTVEIMGSLEGQEEMTVSSEIDEKIDEVYFDFGTYVKAGDKLVSLDKREFEWK